MSSMSTFKRLFMNRYLSDARAAGITTVETNDTYDVPPTMKTISIDEHLMNVLQNTLDEIAINKLSVFTIKNGIISDTCGDFDACVIYYHTTKAYSIPVVIKHILWVDGMQRAATVLLQNVHILLFKDRPVIGHSRKGMYESEMLRFGFHKLSLVNGNFHVDDLEGNKYEIDVATLPGTIETHEYYELF